MCIMRTLAAALAALLALPAPLLAAESCEWTDRVQAIDRERVTVGIDQVLTRIPQAARNNGIAVARGLLQRARTPMALGRLEGRWKVRSIQIDQRFAHAFPYFSAHLTRTPCGFDFAKTSGSQRRSGQLLPMSGSSPAQLAFLGTATVNDDPAGRYGQDSQSSNGTSDGRPRNSAGRLLRLGPNELLMILDYAADGFELYQLKR